jgi:hypothetical protein
MLVSNHIDSELPGYSEIELRTALIGEIRRFQPHVMMSWFPYPNFHLKPLDGWADLGYHLDHQHAGNLQSRSFLCVNSS